MRCALITALRLEFQELHIEHLEISHAEITELLDVTTQDVDEEEFGKWCSVARKHQEQLLSTGLTVRSLRFPAAEPLDTLAAMRKVIYKSAAERVMREQEST